MAASSNIDLTKNSVRKLIKDLMEMVPVPPTTTTAGKARQWFGSQGGVQPVAVKVWMRNSLTQYSLYNGSAVTLTWGNAISYCDDIDEELDEFLANPAPEEEPDATAHAWLNGSYAGDFNPDFVEWFNVRIITNVVVEI